MQIQLSKRECGMLVAALKAWMDPITFFGNGMVVQELFDRFGGKLMPNEVDYLLRRLQYAATTTGGDRLAPTK